MRASIRSASGTEEVIEQGFMIEQPEIYAQLVNIQTIAVQPDQVDHVGEVVQAA